MTMYSVAQEVYILLVTIYGGVLIGFIYDLYKIFRNIFNPKKIATIIQDFLFWTIISVVAFYVLIFSNQGDLRFYNFIGFIIGALVYHYLVSKHVRRALYFILKNVYKFLRDLYQITIYPLRLGVFLLETPYTYCKKKTKPVYYRSKKFLELPGRVVGDMRKAVKNYFKKQ